MKKWLSFLMITLAWHPTASLAQGTAFHQLRLPAGRSSSFVNQYEFYGNWRNGCMPASAMNVLQILRSRNGLPPLAGAHDILKGILDQNPSFYRPDGMRISETLKLLKILTQKYLPQIRVQLRAELASDIRDLGKSKDEIRLVTKVQAITHDQLTENPKALKILIVQLRTSSGDITGQHAQVLYNSKGKTLNVVDPTAPNASYALKFLEQEDFGGTRFSMPKYHPVTKEDIDYDFGIVLGFIEIQD